MECLQSFTRIERVYGFECKRCSLLATERQLARGIGYQVGSDPKHRKRASAEDIQRARQMIAKRLECNEEPSWVSNHFIDQYT
jgi:hypothetical protein